MRTTRNAARVRICRKTVCNSPDVPPRESFRSEVDRFCPTGHSASSRPELFPETFLAAPACVRPVGKAWVKARKRDQFYREAKAQGYRSRAAFKLIQIDARFDLIYEGDVVVDLGAAPGGWSQVARELVGEGGRVVAVDRLGMRPITGVEVWRGDAEDDTLLAALAEKVGRADVVLSDMSPRLSGHKTLDHARSIDLGRHALAAACVLLRPKGNLVSKVFQGDEVEAFRREVSRHFTSVKAHAPEASRKESRELYVIGMGFRG